MIYKYMPYRPEFFENFYIRCSQRSVLNDPFEMEPGLESLIKNFTNRCSGSTYEQTEGLLRKGRLEYIIEKRGAVADVGVMCFSKTKNNIPMWGHYADNSRGMVIGFDQNHDFFNPKKKHEAVVSSDADFNVLECCDELGVPRLKNEFLRDVNYTPERTSSYRHTDDKVLSMDDLLFEKSYQWVCEQEVRMARYLSDADKVLTTNQEMIGLFKKVGVIQNSFYKKECDLWDITDYKNLGVFPYSPDTYYLFSVPKNAIKCVISGAMMSCDKIEIIKAKASEHGFEYCEAKLDHNEYKINFYH